MGGWLYVEIFIQIPPIRVSPANQFGLPSALPSLHRFLALDGFFDVVKNVIINQKLTAIFCAEFGTEVVPMLPNATWEIGGDADIKGAVWAAGHDVDISALRHPINSTLPQRRLVPIRRFSVARGIFV